MELICLFCESEQDRPGAIAGPDVYPTEIQIRARVVWNKYHVICFHVTNENHIQYVLC